MTGIDAFSQLLAVLRVSQYDAWHNAQVREYPDGTTIVTVFDRAIIRERGLEAVGGERRSPDDGEAGDGGEAERPSEESRAAANLARARRRARRAVYDYAMSTDFEYFVTLTVDEKRLNRYDAGEVFRHLHNWLDNHVRRNGLTYVLVPEYHKDGAVHFHALFNDALPVKDSGTISLPRGGKPRRPRSKAQRAAWLAAGGHVVYNLPAWGWGFTTAIRLYGERAAAVGYVCKYISKAEDKIGGRWYYSGGALRGPAVTSNDLDFDTACQLGDPFEVEELGCKAVKIVLKGEEVNEALERLAGAFGPVQHPSDPVV